MNTLQFANIVGRTALGIDHSWVEYLQVTDNAVHFRIGVTERDNHNPTAPAKAWYGRWWVIDGTMNEQQAKNTLLAAVLAYVEHEARERFQIDGKSPYENSH